MSAIHTPSHRPLIGLLPAAGRGTRLAPYRAHKELFPLLLASKDTPGGAATPACHFALRMMVRAGVERCVAVISEDKQEIVRVLRDGGDLGLKLAYLVQNEPRGLTNVVRGAASWLEGGDVAFAMPDTVVFPEDALARAAAELRARDADVVLAVLPTDEPERLAPVVFDADGVVERVYDKPQDPPARNTWGAMVWSSRFTAFCADWDRARDAVAGEPGILGHAIEAARVQGLDVRAVDLTQEGAFCDLGTVAGVAKTLEVLASRGLLYDGTGSE